MQEKIYVVIDTKGSGRVLGVFDSADKADRFTDRFPSYYKQHCCTLNRINPDVVGWADNDEQKQALREMLTEESQNS